jgi:bacteriorhodopsin
MINFLKLPAWIIFIILMLPIPIAGAGNGVGIMIYAVVYVGWLLLMGLSIRKFNPPKIRFSISFFIFRLIFSAIYIIAAGFAFEDRPPNWIIPIHLIAFIFIFTSLAANAKLIVNAETQKENSFIESLGTFLLLWFYPIGVWFVQPRLNAIYNANTGT